MIKGYRIEKFENIDVFLNRMKNFNERTIECTDHTFFRLSEKQRKVFTCEELKKILLNEKPLRVGIQYNGNYAVYYRYKEQRIILEKEQLPRG